MCEVADETNATNINGQADCSMCGSSVSLNWNNTQHVLEHMGTHILHDPKLNTSEERVGYASGQHPCVKSMSKRGMV